MCFIERIIPNIKNLYLFAQVNFIEINTIERREYDRM